MKIKKNKILVVAYACEPNKGSEPGVGWNWTKKMSEFAEIWVITRDNNRTVIESYLKNYPNKRINFIYIDLPQYIRFWKKKQKGVRLYYHLWQIYALFKIPKIINLENITAIHHVTFVNDYTPCYLSLLKLKYKHLRFIWGPIGSHPEVPSRFLLNYLDKVIEKIKIKFRDFSRLNPFFIITKKLADAVIVINKESYRKIYVKKKYIEIIPAIAVESIDYKSRRDSENIKLLFVGRFLKWKGIFVALDAFRLALKESDKNLRFILVGEGKEKNNILRYIEKNKLKEKVTILKWMDRRSLWSIYSSSHIFLYPSFEGAGMVILEAMSCGLPVICLNYGGPGEMVDETCGIKVDITSYEDTVKNLAKAILSLVENENLRMKLSKGAIERIKKYYTWDVKGKQIKEIYVKLGLI